MEMEGIDWFYHKEADMIFPNAFSAYKMVISEVKTSVEMGLFEFDLTVLLSCV